MPQVMVGGGAPMHTSGGIAQQARKKDAGYYKAIQAGQKSLIAATKELKVNRIEEAAKHLRVAASVLEPYQDT